MDCKRDTFFVAESKIPKKRIDKDKIAKMGSNGNEKETVLGGKVKKPFDKKSYRLKKYSKKYKLEQWEEQRKKKLLRNYYKEMNDDPISGNYKENKFDDGNKTETDSSVGKFVRHPDLIVPEESLNLGVEDKNKPKRDPFWKAKERYNKIKEEKQEKRKEVERSKEDKNQKLLEYKKKKADRFKKLSRKTKKGQPVMTGRLELLLEKIQNNK